MKEFDYEKAKAGAPVCTIDGQPARIICWDADRTIGIPKSKEVCDTPICALVTSVFGGERPYFYNESGIMVENLDRNKDLIMATIKHEGWVIIDKGSCFSEIHESKEKAMEFAEREEYDYTAIAHIEWEE